MTERVDRLAGNISFYEWLASWKLKCWGAWGIHTGTKPRTSHHRSHGGERCIKRKLDLDDLPWKDEGGPSSIRRTFVRFFQSNAHCSVLYLRQSYTPSCILRSASDTLSLQILRTRHSIVVFSSPFLSSASLHKMNFPFFSYRNQLCTPSNQTSTFLFLKQ